LFNSRRCLKCRKNFDSTYVSLERASSDELGISIDVECFWQFGIQNFSLAVLIEISTGLQGH